MPFGIVGRGHLGFFGVQASHSLVLRTIWRWKWKGVQFDERGRFGDDGGILISQGILWQLGGSDPYRQMADAHFSSIISGYNYFPSGFG